MSCLKNTYFNIHKRDVYPTPVFYKASIVVPPEGVPGVVFSTAYLASEK